MNDIIVAKLLLSFLVGGTWITAATVIADKFGSKIGGFIASLPSTIVVSLFFIGLVQTPAAAVSVTTIVPLVMSFNALFLVMYVFMSKYNFFVGLGSAFVMWFVFSLIAALFVNLSFWMSVFAFLVVSFASYYVLEKKMVLPFHGNKKMTYTPTMLLGRAVFTGTVIAFSVLATYLAGPLVGGIFSAFPAAFTSTLALTYASRGLEFSRAISRTLLSGMVLTILFYTICVRYLYTLYGLWMGTALSYSLSMAWAYVSYRYILHKIH